MTAELLIRESEACGATLWVEGDRLKCRAPKGALSPEILEGLANQKADILALLSKRDDHARPANRCWELNSLLGKAVETPQGTGVIWQVFQDRVGVVIGGKVRFFDPILIRAKG